MSLLASILPGRSGHNDHSNSKDSIATGAARFISPTIKPSVDPLSMVQLQQSQHHHQQNQQNQQNNQSNYDFSNQSALDSRSAMSQRFLLPLVLDSVNEVSYKVNVPNFENLPPLRLGSKYISDLISIDSITPADLYSPTYLNKSSGLDNYYFDNENGLGNFSRFERVSQVELPDKFFEETNLTQCSTAMGLFPEISRSWIAVDNKLILWNYSLPQSSFNKSAQFTTIDQIRHAITAVKLVTPKPGVFVKDVNYLLLIASTMDIHIYVVKYNQAQNNLDIFNPNLSVSVHGLLVNNFAFDESTRDIYFSADGDGVNVWRLDYHSNASFIKNKCDKVCLTKTGLSSVLPIGKLSGFDIFNSDHNDPSLKLKSSSGAHSAAASSNGSGTAVVPESLVQLEIDSSRKILYTLSNKSVIRSYRLSANQEQFSQHSVLTPSEIFKSVSMMFTDYANIKSLLKFRIVSIQSISTEESSHVLLIAITNFGFRVYLKLGATTSFSFMSAAARPASTSLKLSLVTLRFPPSEEVTNMNPELDSYTRIKQYVAQMVANQQNSTLLKNTKFAKIISPGVFLAVKRTKGSDKLFVSSTNYGFLKRNSKLVEDAEFVKMGSSSSNSAAGGAPVYIHEIVQLTPSMNATNTPNGYANILASQYTKKPLQFAVLTNYGISVYQFRTSDQILGSLKDEVIENFIEENGYEETCSTLLYLSCSYGSYNKKDLFKRKALLLFAHAGNNARLVENTSGSGSVVQPQLQPLDSSHKMIEQVVLSDRFYGTCLLVSRLFRDHWNKKVFVAFPHVKVLPNGSVETLSLKEDNLVLQSLSVTKEQVEYFIGSVFVLLEFLNENHSEIPGLNAPSYSSDPSKMESEVCMRAEHIAFTSMVRSLSSIKEALSFLMVLLEETQKDQNDFNEIVKYLSVTNQVNFLSLTFKDLLLPTQEVKGLIKDLLSSIINKNIVKGGSIDLIASSLQDRCGSFCSSDDVYIFKALENLTKAKSIGNRDNELKNNCLSNAVKLFEQASDSLSLENIENSLDIMLSLEFYTGAVEFLLRLAKRCCGITSTQSSLILSTAGGDASGDAYKEKISENDKKRVRLYDLVFKILTRLDVQAMKLAESGNQMATNEFMDVRDATYDTCFASSDKAFHFEFYQWFINQGYSERLLDVKTPFILPFLEEVAQKDLGLSQLLWLYNAKRENYFDAARFLYTLSISDFTLTLEKRIEFLSRANGFCNCTCPPSLRQEMIHLAGLVNELFEVANVQLDLVNTIGRDERISPDNKKVAREALNGKILTASELFNGYADPLGYYDICFAIFKISDFKNPDEILKRWELFFEKIYHDFDTANKTSAPLYSLIAEAFVPVATKLVPNDVVLPVDRLMQLSWKHIAVADEKPPQGALVDMFLRAKVAPEKLYTTMRSLIEHNSHEAHRGFNHVLRTSEMPYFIRKWYASERSLRDSISPEQIAQMNEYSLESDPLAKHVRMNASFI